MLGGNAEHEILVVETVLVGSQSKDAKLVKAGVATAGGLRPFPERFGGSIPPTRTTTLKYFDAIWVFVR